VGQQGINSQSGDEDTLRLGLCRINLAERLRGLAQNLINLLR
jgi:hypothetical protein